MSRLDANIRGVELFRQANRLTMFTLVYATFLQPVVWLSRKVVLFNRMIFIAAAAAAIISLVIQLLRMINDRKRLLINSRACPKRYSSSYNTVLLFVSAPTKLNYLRTVLRRKAAIKFSIHRVKVWYICQRGRLLLQEQNFRKTVAWCFHLTENENI